MKIGIGTAGLKEEFSEDYWKIFCEALEKEYPIHTCLKYKNTEQYFIRAYKSNLKKPKLIVKIEINKNPIKKINNISKQINSILNKFKVNTIDTIQICNNPNANYFNIFMIKNCLKKYIKSKIIKNLYLESFEPFSNNLNKMIKNDYFNGYLFTLNCFQKGVTKIFFKNILSSQKNIISISPFASYNYEKILNNFDSNYKNELTKIMEKNDFKDYNQLNIAFLKKIKDLKFSIFGTKNYERFKNLENLISNTSMLSDENFFKVLDLQEKYKTIINYK